MLFFNDLHAKTGGLSEKICMPKTGDNLFFYK